MRLRRDVVAGSFLMMALLCQVLVPKAIGGINVVGDDIPRIVGFWQRVGYPGIAEKASVNLLKQGDDATKSYLEFHALPINGSYSERINKDILLPDRNDRLMAGLQKGIQEYPPVLLYQTDRDTIALISVAVSHIKIPRYEHSQQSSNDSIIYLQFTKVCKHYLTSDSSIVRHTTCRDCPLDYQIFDEGYNWRPDADNGMVVPITNLIVRSIRSHGDYVPRHYRTRLLSTPDINRLIFDLRGLNNAIDSAFDVALSCYEQLLTKVGTKDHKVDDAYSANGYGVPIKVKLFTNNIDATGNRTSKQLVIPQQQVIPNQSSSYVADIIYKKPEVNAGTLLDADIKWDNVNSQFVKGPKYNKYQFADELGLGESSSDWPKCCFRLHAPQSRLAMLNTKVLAHRVFALNELSRVINNSVDLIRQADRHSGIDSLRKIIGYRKKELEIVSDKVEKVGRHLEYVKSKFEDESRNNLIQQDIAGEKATDVAVKPTTSFAIDLGCQALESDRARESVTSIAWLISRAAGATKEGLQLGQCLNTSDRVERTEQLAKDSKYFEQLALLLREVEEVVGRHDPTLLMNLRYEHGLIDTAIQLHRGQYDQPVSTQRYLRLRGACQDNHALNLFAISVSRNPTLVNADEDDVVDTIRATAVDRYRLIFHPSNPVTDDELDDYDDSVETYQEMLEEGLLLDRIVEMPGKIYNIYEVDRSAIAAAAEKCLATYSKALITAQSNLQAQTAEAASSLRLAEKEEDLLKSISGIPIQVFNMEQADNQNWPPTNFVGSKPGDIDSAVASYQVSRGYDNKYKPIEASTLQTAAQNIPTFTVPFSSGLAISQKGDKSKYSLCWIVDTQVGSTWRNNLASGIDSPFFFSSLTYVNMNLYKDVVLANDLMWSPYIETDPTLAKWGSFNYAAQHRIMIVGLPNRKDPNTSLIRTEQLYYLGSPKK
jgi:hypothetical protein